MWFSRAVFVLAWVIPKMSGFLKFWMDPQYLDFLGSNFSHLLINYRALFMFWRQSMQLHETKVSYPILLGQLCPGKSLSLFDLRKNIYIIDSKIRLSIYVYASLHINGQCFTFSHSFLQSAFTSFFHLILTSFLWFWKGR